VQESAFFIIASDRVLADAADLLSMMSVIRLHSSSRYNLHLYSTLFTENQ